MAHETRARSKCSDGVLVHEWLARHGGSENVFAELASVFPENDLLCLWNDDPDRFSERNLQETWLARTPLRRFKAAALPLLPFVWRRRRPGGYRWALVSSHLFAHHVSFIGAPADFRKLLYVHTPARYIWTPDLDVRGRKPLVRLASAALRPLDRKRALEASAIAANSEFVRRRIASTWGRDAVVIHPPVDVERIQAVTSWYDQLGVAERQILDALPPTFILGASRFIEYKRLDRVLEIGEAAGLPVVLAGSGPLETQLRLRAENASVDARVIHRPSDALLFALYERAEVYVFPPVEDFGIMPVEAHAAGCPTLVHSVGGAQESTKDGVTGAVIDIDAPDSEVLAALDRARSVSRSKCREDALRFSRATFAQRILAWVTETVPGVPAGPQRGGLL